MVINDMIRHTRNYNPFTLDWKRLTVHSKLVILTSAGLLGLGTLIVFFFEFDNTMLGLSSIDKLIAAAFQSVTFRTAGFNTIDISAMRNTTLFAGILFMFIGATPATTRGGIKTTPLAVLFHSVRSLLRTRDKVEVFDRTIMHQTVYKSIAIVLFSFTFLMIITMLLLATQTGSFLAILFEAASALGTVGLSAGMTGELDTLGKILITILMYVGRIGPLTVALALGEVRTVKVEYPTARVTVG
jgi:trk system potassium uptake protein TrkH